LFLSEGYDITNNIKGLKHVALIDGYNITNEDVFEVKINWGWGNRGGVNDRPYPTTGSIFVTHVEGTDIRNLRWDKFNLYYDVVPW
jgi:hypothetical protein